jgi:hypothetical protein
MLCIPLFCEIGSQYPFLYYFVYLFFLFPLIVQMYYADENPLGGQWPDAVPCDEHGAVDVAKLVKLVDFFAEKGHPPIIVMNYGTTFTVCICIGIGGGGNLYLLPGEL